MALATAIGDKKGEEVRVLDLRGVCGFADYFVFATGGSDRHVRALADAAVDAAARARREAARRRGQDRRRAGCSSTWAQIVVHVFSEDAREYFGLERLWGDAEELDVARAVGAAS